MDQSASPSDAISNVCDVNKTTAVKTRTGKKARLLTPARREQNRQAQRAYRQRQREWKAKTRAEQADAASPSVSRRLAPLLPNRHQHGSVSSRNALAEKNSDGAVVSEYEWQSLPDAAPSQATPSSASRCTSAKTTTRDQSRGTHSTSSTVSSDSTSYRNVSQSRESGPIQLSDPRGSNLQLAQITLSIATLHNARCMGFDLARVATCGPDYMSPFYRPDADLKTDPRSLVDPTALTKSLPPNLRPTLAQILVPHHASLDLIPIPMLRDRAILLSVTKPDMCDLFELKLDIFHKGGLMAWGSQRHRGDNGLGEDWDCEGMEGREWAPWNRRCWEAAPWFLNKWAIAVDGDEGELGKQSRWWKTVREAREVHELGATV